MNLNQEIKEKSRNRRCSGGKQEEDEKWKAIFFYCCCFDRSREAKGSSQILELLIVLDND